MSKIFIRGVPRGSPRDVLAGAIREVFLEAADNLSWLEKGDSVLLKPALNAGDPYPATTHPLSAGVVGQVLAEHGARVYVGDQSGIEAIVSDPSGVRRGHTRDTFVRSGMAREVPYPFVSFETLGWEDGYRHFRSPEASSWPEGFFITRCVDRADHIVNLPRLSTHSQAGVTLGFKNWVGALRDDSRVEFHAAGPFFRFIEYAVRDSSLQTEFGERTASFFDRMTEISLAVADKLRATLFTGTKAQLTFGPNAYAVAHSYGGLGSAYVVEPDPGLVFASADPVTAEAFALAFLTSLYPSVPRHEKLAWKAALFLNGQAQELGRQSVWENPFVARAIELGLGSRSAEPVWHGVPGTVQEALPDRYPIPAGQVIHRSAGPPPL
jgi:uncharacterized protein (DUF362 family)